MAVASAKTGAVGSETPDGNVVYLNARFWKPNAKSMIKRKPAIAGASGYCAGVRDIKAVIQNCPVVAVIGANSTAEVILIENFFYTHSLKVGAKKCYLFIKHIANNVWEKLSWDSSDNHLQYILGSPMDWDHSCKDGKVYRMNMNFGEITTPTP